MIVLALVLWLGGSVLLGLGLLAWDRWMWRRPPRPSRGPVPEIRLDEFRKQGR
jgi:uncharacterized iron-regulated membrane protein